jgi:hypothetical protein
MVCNPLVQGRLLGHASSGESHGERWVRFYIMH